MADLISANARTDRNFNSWVGFVDGVKDMLLFNLAIVSINFFLKCIEDNRFIKVGALCAVVHGQSDGEIAFQQWV